MRSVVLASIAALAAGVIGAGVPVTHGLRPLVPAVAASEVAQQAAHRSLAPTPPRPRPRGTNAWRLTKPALNGQIEGYATTISARPGQRVSLRVSTTASRYQVLAFRF